MTRDGEKQIPRSFFFIDESGHLPPDDHAGELSRIASRHICDLLGLRDLESRQKLLAAVRRAATERVRTVLMLDADPDPRRMVTIRPAREAGWAVVSCTELMAAVAQLDTSALADLFSLSPAEAEIAVMLAQGSTLAEVAERRVVQPETVRGQVKVLLRKIGVANQKQLAGLLAQVGAALQDAYGSPPPADTPALVEEC